MYILLLQAGCVTLASFLGSQKLQCVVLTEAYVCFTAMLSRSLLCSDTKRRLFVALYRLIGETQSPVHEARDH